ncbi:MAG: hypothetical protein ABIP79_11045 [Chitinophagaceae bacterium]
MRNYMLYLFSYLTAMADVHDKKTRSYNMSQIKATNTKPSSLLMVVSGMAMKTANTI